LVEGDNKTAYGETRVGRAIAVSASRATILLDCQTEAPVEMGDVVKLRTRAGAVYGMVSRLDIANPGSKPSDQDLKTAEIEFAGEIRETDCGGTAFQRGASAYPALDETVWRATPRICSKSMPARKPRPRESARSTKLRACRPTF
jgi:hypothetical protein